MKIPVAARKSGLLSITIIAAALLWELLTFELPRPGRASGVGDQVAIHATLFAMVALAVFLGNLLAFCTFRSTAYLTPSRAFVLGAASAVVIFFAVVPLLKHGGSLAIFVGVAVLMFVTTATAGRLLSKHGA